MVVVVVVVAAVVNGGGGVSVSSWTLVVALTEKYQRWFLELNMVLVQIVKNSIKYSGVG